MKKCSSCEKYKDSENDFHKNKVRKDGRHGVCKSCRSAWGKAKLKSPEGEAIRAKYRDFYAANREEVLRKSRRYFLSEKVKAKVSRYGRKSREVNKERYKKEKREYYQKNKEEILKKSRIALKRRRVSFDFFALKLPATDKPVRDPKNLNILLVRCMKCGRHFRPNTGQVYRRKLAFYIGTGSASNFYCSDLCQSTCPNFKFQADKFDSLKAKENSPRRRRTARACQTKHLKQLQCDETGYNYCEACGDIIDVDLHHTHRVGTKDSISSAGHLLLCHGCHVNIHRRCNGK